MRYGVQRDGPQFFLVDDYERLQLHASCSRAAVAEAAHFLNNYVPAPPRVLSPEATRYWGRATQELGFTHASISLGLLFECGLLHDT